MEFKHTSVLLDECIDGLKIKKGGVYVDGTLGGGGHSLHIARALDNTGRLIGVDQDENAIEAASKRLVGFSNITYIHKNFSQIEEIAKELDIDGIDGILLDLGVSSYQLDEADRGFSYQHNAALDMRMDVRNSLSAYSVVNTYTQDELYRVIRDYGEEKWAKRIAEFIVNERKEKPIETTFDLVDVIKKAIPRGARSDGPHPAKRTFQAIRIEVNGELVILEDTIKKMADLLNPGGRLCIITFHSLEDRIVKNTFKTLENPCTCPREFPVCVCGKKPIVRVITRKPILPGRDELENNNRAHSAKLRIAEKL